MPTIRIHDVMKKSEEIASWLYENFPGCQLNIPKKKSSMLFKSKEEMDKFIYQNYCNTMADYKSIADKLGLEEDTVRKIVSKMHNERY